MKMTKWFVAAVVTAAVIALTGCGTGPAAAAPEDLPPPGTERISLENGAYAIFRFDLPPGAVWSDFNRITAEYRVDDANMRRRQRNDGNVRLMGPYVVEMFEPSGRNMIVNLNDNFNAPFILDDRSRTFASMGAVAGEWFTVTYDISGAAAHAQFAARNFPAPDATGPFLFGLGIPAHDEFRGITQYIRNVTLHHATNPALSVVSTGSGFDYPAFASFSPVLSTWVSGPPLAAAAPEAPALEEAVVEEAAYEEVAYYYY